MALSDQISDPQIELIRSLLREKATDRLTEQQREWLESADFATLNRAQARRVIDALMALPKDAAHADVKLDIGIPPNGRYAATEADGVLRFYKINTPTEGKWAGFTFVDVQASDELYPIKDRARKNRVLALVMADVQGAMLRYGQELGHCGHCGRTLTNELSRELGIGPICRGKMGW